MADAPRLELEPLPAAVVTGARALSLALTAAGGFVVGQGLGLGAYGGAIGAGVAASVNLIGFVAWDSAARRLRARMLASAVIPAVIGAGVIAGALLSDVRAAMFFLRESQAEAIQADDTEAALRRDVIQLDKRVEADREAEAAAARALAIAQDALAAHVAFVGRGDQNEAVDIRRFQQSLVDAGFEVGRIDGRFGNATQAAASAHQTQLRRAVDIAADDLREATNRRTQSQDRLDRANAELPTAAERSTAERAGETLDEGQIEVVAWLVAILFEGVAFGGRLALGSPGVVKRRRRRPGETVAEADQGAEQLSWDPLAIGVEPSTRAVNRPGTVGLKQQTRREIAEERAAVRAQINMRGGGASGALAAMRDRRRAIESERDT